MTILNALIKDDCAIVGVNTEMYPLVGINRAAFGLKGSARHTSKMVPLSHLNCVIATRGSLNFLTILFANCSILGGDDIDTLIENMPALITKAANELRPIAHQSGINDLSHQGVIAGWSYRNNRPVANAFELDAHARMKTWAPVDDVLLCPWESSWGEPPGIGNQDEMREAVRQQAVHLRRIEPAPGLAAAGGRFVAATMRASGTMIESLFEIAD